METEKIKTKILDQAKQLGADEAEAYILNKRLVTVRLASKQIVESKGISDYGVGIRIIKDKAIGFTITNDFAERNLKKTVKDAFSIARVRGPAKHWKNLPKPQKIRAVPKIFDKKIAELETDEAVDLAIRMLDAAENFHEKIVDVSGSSNAFVDEVYIANTQGIDVTEASATIFGSITTEAEDRGSRVSGVGFQGACSLSEFTPEKVGEHSGEMAVKSLGEAKIESGTYSLILDPYALAEVTSYVLARSVRSKTYQDKVSCFQGKLGAKIADERFSIYDDPTLPGYMGSASFDDEGVPTRRLPIIEKGILKNLQYDTFYASKDDVPSTGNAKRTGNFPGRTYASIPFPEPHDFVVEKGDMSRTELIEDTKQGILVGRIWYTYPLHPERGDFSTTTRSGAFLVKNGEIQKSIMPMRIFDNLPRCLMNIGGIANNVKQVTPWFGYYLVAPTIRFDNVKAVPV